MSSDISYKDQSFWVSNQRLGTLVALALEIGAGMAKSPDETAFVQRLREEEDTGVLFPGCSFDLDERFPSVAAKQFWVRVFLQVAQGIFERRIGNQEIDSWQTSTICDAHLVARMLQGAVHGTDSDGLA